MVYILLQGAEPPILVASDLGFEDIADLLVKHGADLNKHDEVRFYVTHYSHAQSVIIYTSTWHGPVLCRVLAR